MPYLYLIMVYFFLSICLAAPNPQFTNNAPFSGIVYLVAPNGEPLNGSTFSTTLTNLCPQQAPVSCSNRINEPSFCCPPNTYCWYPEPETIGCCPNSKACELAGSNDATAPHAGEDSNSTVTVTVTVAAQSQPPTNAAPGTTQQAGTGDNPQTTQQGGGGNNPQTMQQSGDGNNPQATQQDGSTVNNPQTTQQGGTGLYAQSYCSTLTMRGPALPTAKQGHCGTILIVNEGVRGVRVDKVLGLGAEVACVVVHLGLWRMGVWVL